jgi:hypothetical protein
VFHSVVPRQGLNEVWSKYVFSLKYIDLHNFLSPSLIQEDAFDIVGIKMRWRLAFKVPHFTFCYNYECVFLTNSRKHEYLNSEGGPIPAEQQDNNIGRSIIKQVNRILLGNLSKKVPHLVKCQVKYT